jgi:hypothetical protein
MQMTERRQLVAKKDWQIVQNGHNIKIEKGQPLPADLPKKFIETLKTENVI